jgi:hypothetical protein
VNAGTREHRLRARIDKLTRERDRYATAFEAVVVPVVEVEPVPPAEPARIVNRCVYCGWPCRARACADHRDLVRLDPHYEGVA